MPIATAAAVAGLAVGDRVAVWAVAVVAAVAITAGLRASEFPFSARGGVVAAAPMNAPQDAASRMPLAARPFR